MRKLATLLISIGILVSSAAPVSASVAGLLSAAPDGSCYLYDYRELLDSYALKLIGRPNGLYEDYISRTPAAFLHSDGLILDYQDTIDFYAALVLTGQKFDFNSFAKSGSSKKLGVPVSLYSVTASGGQLISQKINISPQALISSAVTPVIADITSAVSPATPAPTMHDTRAESIPIVAASQVSQEKAVAWAAGRNAHPRFIDIARAYWEYGQRTGICPEVLYAQSAHETRFGHFTGQVPPTYNNWAGIKTANATGDNPEDHEQFATPEDGVRAHFNHMAAYVGLNPIGELHNRYAVVKRLPWAGTVTTVEQLSGKWAPSAAYHQRIVLFLSEMAR